MRPDPSRPCAVYLVTNKETGNTYIGISTNPRERWLAHKSATRRGSDLVFHRALRKHPESAFEWTVLVWAKTFSEAADLEIWGRAMGLGTYNMTRGGEGVVGQVISEETRQKLSRVLKGRVFTDEWKQKISEAKRGHTVSEATREKLRIAASNPENLARLVARNKTDAAREASRKVGLSGLGRTSAAVKALWTPELKAQRSEIVKTRYTPEMRAAADAKANAAHARKLALRINHILTLNQTELSEQ